MVISIATGASLCQASIKVAGGVGGRRVGGCGRE